MTVSKDYSTLYTGHNDGRITCWNLQYSKYDLEIKQTKTILAHEDCVNCIVICQKLNILLTGSEDGMVYIRNLYDFELLTSIKVKFNLDDKKHSVIDIKVSTSNYVYVTCYYKEKFVLLGYTVNGILFSHCEMLFNNVQFTLSGCPIIGQYTSNKILILDPVDLNVVY